MSDTLSNVFELTKDVGGILLVVFYLSVVLWTYKDARRRIEDPILVATSVATSMLPIVGVLIYMMLRPPEYLADARERELEIRAMERELGRQERCPYCKSHIEANYLSCPVCMTKLRQSCSGCSTPLDPRWAMCPLCELEVPRAARERSQPADRRGSRPAPRSRGSQPASKARAAATRAPRSSDSSAPSAPGTPQQGPAAPEAARSVPVRPEAQHRVATPAVQAPVQVTPIATEPFQASVPNRITGSRSSIDQPTMPQPAIPTTEQ